MRPRLAEQNLLGLHRTQDDVPGWLIPSLYYNYLRTGDARGVDRVFYHNGGRAVNGDAGGANLRQLSTSVCDDAIDLVSLGRWQADLGLHAEAERTLRSALDSDLPLEAYQLALYHLNNL